MITLAAVVVFGVWAFVPFTDEDWDAIGLPLTLAAGASAAWIVFTFC